MVPYLISYLIGTDVPYTHSRNGQKFVWRRHFDSLKQMGLLRGVSGFKTLLKWANAACKERVAFRAKEKRTSGLASVAEPAVIDTLSGYWHAHKVSQDLMSEASHLHAEIVREASTTTNASLAARAAVLQEARNAAHRARLPTPRTGDAGGSTHSAASVTASDDVSATFTSPRPVTPIHPNRCDFLWLMFDILFI